MNGNRSNQLLGSLSLLLLSACGGGGDTPSVDSSSIPLALSADNAAAVTAEVLDGGLSANGLDVEPLVPVALSVSGDPIRFSSSQLLQLALKPALELSPEGLSGVTGVSQTTYLDCQSGSAKVTVTASHVDPYVPTPGDRLGIDANDCTYSETVNGTTLSISMDGAVSVTLETPSSFPPRADFPTHASWSSYSLNFSEQQQLQATFNRYHITLMGAESLSMTLDGNMELKAATNATGNLAYDAMSGDVSLSLASRGQTLDFSLDNLDLEGLARQDGNGSMFGELRYNASYGSHTLGGVGGRVTVSTLDNLIHDDTSGHPLTSGKLAISGASGSSVTVTIPGPASDLELAIDSNGDAIIDRTLDLNWADLNEQ